MLKIEVCVSTIGPRISNLKHLNQIQFYPGLTWHVIHQVSDNNDYNEIFKNKNIRYSQIGSKGLSNSRNYAILNSDADYILFADDDLNFHLKDIYQFSESLRIYQPDIMLSILENEHGEPIRDYPNEGLINIEALSAWSPEICAKLKSLRKHRILFDESFGAGTSIPLGEEMLFMHKCLSEKLKIHFIPLSLFSHESNSHTSARIPTFDLLKYQMEVHKKVLPMLAFIIQLLKWVIRTKGLSFYQRFHILSDGIKLLMRPIF